MKIILFFLCFVVSMATLAQGDADLFRFSKTETFGNARFTAMGGAFGALGADVSSSQINPAGFGRFSSNHFNVSLGSMRTKNSVLFEGTTTNSSEFSVRPNSVGLVFVQDDSRRESGYQYIQFGLGYNRVQNFNNSFTYKGLQYESLIESFAASANGTLDQDLYFTHPFTSSLAWETYTINPGSGENSYVAALYNEGDQYHQRTVTIKGGMGEYYASLSGNYMNVLYLGANIGLRTINYEEDILHREEVTDTVGNDLRSFDYTYNLRTKGSGMNFKLGAIYLPKDNIRLGLAFHSATYFQLTDDTEADMIAHFQNITRTVPQDRKPYGNYKYRLRTPPKLIASAAYIFGTKGCISVDMDFINYKWANLRSTTDLQNYAQYNFTIENAEAKKVLKSAVNLRVGGEFVINSTLFIRGGFSLSSQAYNSLVEVENGWDKSVSSGIGYKYGRNSFEVGLRQSFLSRNYFAFPGSVAQNDMRMRSLVFSYVVAF